MRDGRIRPRDAVPSLPCCPPAHLPLGAAEGVTVSQPASDFGSAPEGLAASWMGRRRICNGEWAGRQDIAWLVHFLMYVWAREKMLPLTLLPGGHSTSSSDTGKSGTGKAAPHRTSIRHPRARAQPLLVFTSTMAQMPCSRLIPGITSGEKKGI